ncbi:MAG: leucine-rich repeat domain-containing protein, partial [Lachnospiraceae bacterium]|nr:leucine-rich repeat domain-containing protein [Lachnospiraceae bacterium]
MKIIVSLLIVLIMTVTSLAAETLFVEGEEINCSLIGERETELPEDYYDYYGYSDAPVLPAAGFSCLLINGEFIRITEYNGDDADLVIPARARPWYGSGYDYPVKEIDAGVFKDNTKIKSVQVSCSINEGAFWGCDNLERVVVNNYSSIIESNAFKDCKNLREVIIYGANSIGSRAFSGCENLESVTLAYGVESIGALAFVGCKKLESISLPLSVENIGGGLFSGCSKLTSVYVDSDN